MNCLEHGRFPEEGSCPVCDGMEQLTTKQGRVSDENITDLLEMMHLHPNGTYAIISKNEPVGAHAIHSENMTSILKDLQQLRAAIPKVREAIENRITDSSGYGEVLNILDSLEVE